MADHPLLRTAIRVGGSAYTFADALRLGVLTGTWDGVEASLRGGHACAAQAATEGSPLEDSALTEALRDFRYRHNLIAAEEAEAWLRAWDLDVTAWREAIQRLLLVAHWRDDLAAILTRHPPTDGDLAAAAWADLVCSGALERLVQDLAEHVAVAGDAAPSGPEGDEPPLPAWLGLTQGGPPLRRVREVCAERRRVSVTPEAVTAAVSARPLDWTHVALVRATFPAEPMAAEAALRVREDREALADVVREVGQPVESWSGFLAAAPPEVRARVLTAGEGDLLGPLATGSDFALIQVLSRRPPSAEDPKLRDAVAGHLWSRAAARALDTVRFEFPRETHGG